MDLLSNAFTKAICWSYRFKVAPFEIRLLSLSTSVSTFYIFESYLLRNLILLLVFASLKPLNILNLLNYTV